MAALGQFHSKHPRAAYWRLRQRRLRAAVRKAEAKAKKGKL